MNNLQQVISSQLSTELVRFDEPMSLHTSFRIGGPADVFLAPCSQEELLQCLELVRRLDLPFFLLGGGTNILVSDRGIRGVVIQTSGLAHINIQGNLLVAQAGARVEDVCEAAAAHCLTGVEFLHGMPGTIGGAVWMNARCYGYSVSEVLERVEVIGEDLALSTVHHDPEEYGYKRSPFQAMPGCIWEVALRLEPGDGKEIRRRMAANYADRVEKGHFRAPSAGSLFKNNHAFGAPTGKIIDELGLRGKTIGGAAIAAYHGNIFINQDNATAGDVLALIHLAVEAARRERNIRLEPEVRLVGDWRPEDLTFLQPSA